MSVRMSPFAMLGGKLERGYLLSPPTKQSPGSVASVKRCSPRSS